MTWQELLNEGEKRLSKKGVPEAKLNAWYLFSDCFETSKSGFFLNQELETESEKTERFLALIAKRCERIPLEYLLGETECLVEEVLKKCEEADVLDLCTGSGCIGISLGKLGNCKSVTLSDISEGALFTAKENAGRNQVDVTCIQSDLFVDIEGTFDVIVSNPPYIESDEILMLMPEVRDYEERMGLDGSADGILFYRCIIKEAPKYLRKNGYLFFEIGCEQADAVSGLMEAAGFKEITIKKDYCGRNRIVFGLQTEMVR